MQLTDIISKIERRMKTTEKRPYVVAIDGMCASGKTTLGETLHRAFPKSNLFHMDDYFLQPHQRTSKRLAEAGGNVDYERFKEEIVLHLGDKNGLSYQIYDCMTQSLSSPIKVDWQPLVIIEGAYSQHPYFGDVYDMRIFCEISREEQLERILKRNGSSMLERFVNEWIPMENQYFEHYNIKTKPC